MRTAAALVAAAAVISYLDHAQQDRTHGAWLGAAPRYRTYGDRAPNYRMYGDLEKPPLVIIPGLDGCTVFFQGVVPELVRDFFVVVHDLPLYNGQNYTFSYLAADVTKALDELDIERAAIVGESFGGVVAQHVALEHPSRVEALVLLSSLAKTELTAVVKFKLHVLLPVVEFLGRAFPGLAQTIFAKVHASDVVEASEPAWARSLFVKEASWAHHASVMQRIKIVAALDIEDRVPNIAAPVLLVRGANDSFTGHTTARLRSLLRRVDVVTLPGGHLPHVTSSLAFARVARDFFLFNSDDAIKELAEKWKEDDGEGQILSDDRSRAIMRRLLVEARRFIEPRLRENEKVTAEDVEEELDEVFEEFRARWADGEDFTKYEKYMRSLFDDMGNWVDESSDDKPEDQPPSAADSPPKVVPGYDFMDTDNTVIYMTDTPSLDIRGAGFRAKPTELVFDPPLERDVDYVLNVRSATNMRLVLQSGKRWRSDGAPGPLKLLSIDGMTWGENGYVTVAVVQIDLGPHGVTVDDNAGKIRLYQSSPGCYDSRSNSRSNLRCVEGRGFNTNAALNDLRWASSLGPDDYTIDGATGVNIGLRLKPGSVWHDDPADLPGPLKLLAVDAGAGFVAVGPTEARTGSVVATIFEDPVVDPSPQQTVYQTQTRELWITGRGFTPETTLTFGTLDSSRDRYEAYHLPQAGQHYVMLVFNRTHLRLTLQENHKWAQQDGILRVTGIDTGAGQLGSDRNQRPSFKSAIVANVALDPDPDS